MELLCNTKCSITKWTPKTYVNILLTVKSVKQESKLTFGFSSLSFFGAGEGAGFSSFSSLLVSIGGPERTDLGGPEPEETPTGGPGIRAEF